MPDRTIDRQKQRDGVVTAQGDTIGGAAYVGLQLLQMGAALAGGGKR